MDGWVGVDVEGVDGVDGVPGVVAWTRVSVTVTLDAPGGVVRELAGRLEALPKVSVKTTFAREINAKGGGGHDEP